MNDERMSCELCEVGKSSLGVDVKLLLYTVMGIYKYYTSVQTYNKLESQEGTSFVFFWPYKRINILSLFKLFYYYSVSITMDQFCT